MGFFERFSYTNFHDLNLDWILNAIRHIPEKTFGETWTRLSFPGKVEIAIRQVSPDPTGTTWANYPVYDLDLTEQYEYLLLSHTVAPILIPGPFSGSDGKLVLVIPGKNGIWPKARFIESGADSGKIALDFDAIAYNTETLPVTLIAIAW